MWQLFSYVAWGISIAMIAWMVFDWIKIDTTYSEEVLTSSREGELEAATSDHKVHQQTGGN